MTTSTHASIVLFHILPARFELAHSLHSLLDLKSLTRSRAPTTTALSDASPNSLTHCHSAIFFNKTHPSSLLQGVASRGYDMLPMGMSYDRSTDRIFLVKPLDFPSAGYNTRWLASHYRGDIASTAIAAISDYNTMVESEAGTAWLKRAGWKAFPVPSHEDFLKRVEPSLSTDAWGHQKPASIFNYMNGLHDVSDIIDSTAPLSFGGTVIPYRLRPSSPRRGRCFPSAGNRIRLGQPHLHQPLDFPRGCLLPLELRMNSLPPLLQPPPLGIPRWSSRWQPGPSS